MSFYANCRQPPRRFRLILSSFAQQDGLPFASVLPEQAIGQAFAEAEVDFAQEDKDVYTPALTLWMEEAAYARMPASIQVREVQVQVEEPGCRTESLVVVAALTDPERYTRDDVADLYHQRWLVELDIRALKVTLGMDVLRRQSAEMVRREIWTCLLAYNLIRRTMLDAALRAGRSPRQLSFTAALQKIAAAWAVLSSGDATLCAALIDVMLRDVAKNRVGDRPDRVEPRAVKRRPKPHALLNEPRAAARAKLLGGVAG